MLNTLQTRLLEHYVMKWSVMPFFSPLIFVLFLIFVCMVLSLYLWGRPLWIPLGRTHVYSLLCLSLRATGSAHFFSCQGHAVGSMPQWCFTRRVRWRDKKKWQRMCTNVKHDWLTAKISRHWVSLELRIGGREGREFALHSLKGSELLLRCPNLIFRSCMSNSITN